MTEKEWLESDDFEMMWWFVRKRVSERKLRLVAVDFFTQFSCYARGGISWSSNRPPGNGTDVDREMRRIWASIDVAERHADGLATDHELAAVAIENDCRYFGLESMYAYGWAATSNDVASALASVARAFRGGASRGTDSERCKILREIVGNPFLPADIDPYWLIWNDRIVRRFAQSIYDERVYDRMPILADALEEAGCADESILQHCRLELELYSGPHVRGCWCLDLLLA